MFWETFALVPKSNHAPTKSLIRFARFSTPAESKQFEWVNNFFQPTCFIPPSARPTQLLESGTCLDLCTNLRSVDQQLWMRFLQRWKPLGEDVTHKGFNLTGLSPMARGLPGTLSRCLLEDLAWISAEDAHPAFQMRGNRC